MQPFPSASNSKYLAGHQSLSPEVPADQSESEASRHLFGMLDRPEAPSFIPIQTGVHDHLATFTKSYVQRPTDSKKARYNVYSLMFRCYKLPVNQETNWSKPHVVPPVLLYIVDDSKKMFDAKADQHCLKKDKEAGRMEEKAKLEVKGTHSSMQVRNSLTISLVGIQQALVKSASVVAELGKIPALSEDPQASALFEDPASITSDTSHVGRGPTKFWGPL